MCSVICAHVCPQRFRSISDVVVKDRLDQGGARPRQGSLERFPNQFGIHPHSVLFLAGATTTTTLSQYCPRRGFQSRRCSSYISSTMAACCKMPNLRCNMGLRPAMYCSTP
jgi:hypothetical protein